MNRSLLILGCSDFQSLHASPGTQTRRIRTGPDALRSRPFSSCCEDWDMEFGLPTKGQNYSIRSIPFTHGLASDFPFGTSLDFSPFWFYFEVNDDWTTLTAHHIADMPKHAVDAASNDTLSPFLLVSRSLSKAQHRGLQRVLHALVSESGFWSLSFLQDKLGLCGSLNRWFILLVRHWQDS